MTLGRVRRLLVAYPLDRFVIQGLLERLPAGPGAARLVRVRPEVWAGLRGAARTGTKAQEARHL
jgi:hypothetical protein